jgi:hypothetical protein
VNLLGEIVEHAHRIASGSQGRRQCRTDETGSPGDEYELFHDHPSLCGLAAQQS